MSGDRFKMQLSSGALEKLVGTDPQFELELKQNVVAAFYQRRIKAIMNDEVMKTRLAAIEEEAKREFSIQCQANIAKVSSTNWKPTVELFPSVVAKIHKLAEDHVEVLLQQLVDAKMAELMPVITEKIASHVGYKFDHAVRTEVDRRLKLLSDMSDAQKVEAMLQGEMKKRREALAAVSVSESNS